MVYLSYYQNIQKKPMTFVEYMTRPEVMQKYYDVDGSPTAIEGSNKQERIHRLLG